MKIMQKIVGIVLVFTLSIGAGLFLREHGLCAQGCKGASIDISIAKNLENIMPIVVVGSGPAALSAALYGSRGGVKTLVIRGNKPGGALTETSDIENWPGRGKIQGRTLMSEFQEQVQSFGAEFLNDTVASINFSKWPYTIQTEGGKTIKAMAVVLATGSTPRTLGIPGEQEYWGKGVTTCAVCDAPSCKGFDVVVVGGGDTAAEEAMQLAPFAKTITLIVRQDHLRASKAMQDRLKAYPNISISYHKELKAIEGDGKHVTSVELFDNKANTTEKVPMPGVFLAIGHTPNTSLVKDVAETDDQGYILLKGRSQQTSLPFLYAAGDVADDHYKQAGVAAGDGIKAALDAVGALQEMGYNPTFALALENNLFSAIADGTKPVNLVSSSQELDTILAKAEGPVVLDFFADYCPSCMRMIPALESVAYQFDKEVQFYKVDMGKDNDLAKKYEVSSIPALLVFDDNKLVARYTKAMNKKELRECALRHLKEKQQAA